MPPLRERREDIVALAEHFLRHFAGKYHKPELQFHADAISAMLRYAWPGNVRELEHVVERAVLLAKDSRIQTADVALQASSSRESLDEMSLDEVESYLIRRAVQRYSGNVQEAAKALGLSRSALYRRMAKYGVYGGVQKPAPQS
jgi:DNA-binding NtrC family response regulator